MRYIGRIEASLALFHAHKQSIIDADARVGQGNQTIELAYSQLELMQSVVPTLGRMVLLSNGPQTLPNMRT